MKKYSSIIIAVLLTLSITTVFAASPAFTDENSFSDWFKNSVKYLQNQDILQGYPDGSFQPNNKVSRAELAVILDRYEDNIVQKKIENYFNSSIQKIIDNIERFDDKDIDYKSAIIMAESGQKKLAEAPNLALLTKDEDANIPEGYEVYNEENIIIDTYLHFVGERADGDVRFQVDEWYGPF